MKLIMRYKRLMKLKIHYAFKLFENLNVSRRLNWIDQEIDKVLLDINKKGA